MPGRATRPTLGRVAIAFTIYLLLGPLAWLGICVVSMFARKRMSRLHANRDPLPEPAPTLSIVVPAKDEAAGLRDCVSRILAQDYPGFELVVIDDRSTDGTTQLLDVIAAAEPRVRAAHVTQLPPGWLGKCHALHVGTRELTSEWLLFVDSDVQLAPDAARRAMALAAPRGYDALSIMPQIDARSFLERAMLPLLATLWGATFRISMTNEDSRPELAFANGQFFLIRRDRYEKVGGHAAVRDQIVEDVSLMRVLKRDGARTRFMFGGELGRTRMHTHLRQMAHGWARIFAGSAGRSIWPIVAAIAVLAGTLAMIVVGIVLSIATAHPSWIGAAVAHVVLVLGYTAWAYATAGQNPLLALLVPATWPVVIGMLVFALRACRTGTVVWRGNAVGIGRDVGAKQASPGAP